MLFRSHCLVFVLEPYVCVGILELIVFDQASQLPRNLNETRFGFIHSEKDGIEGVGTSRLDLEAVLFVRSPVLQAKQREELGTEDWHWV